MDPVVVLEVIYLVSALLCAILVPIELAIKAQGRRTYPQSWRYYLTYGQIFIGFLVGLIPAINTYHALKALHNRLNAIHIFKPKE